MGVALSCKLGGGLWRQGKGGQVNHEGNADIFPIVAWLRQSTISGCVLSVLCLLEGRLSLRPKHKFSEGPPARSQGPKVREAHISILGVQPELLPKRGGWG